MINRETKRARIVERYAAKRAALRETLGDPSVGDEQRREARRPTRSFHRPQVPSVSLCSSTFLLAE